MYLTDYLDPILENLRYNRTLNSNLDDESDCPGSSPEEIAEHQAARRAYCEKIAKAQVCYLNWDEVSDDNPGTTVRYYGYQFVVLLLITSHVFCRLISLKLI